MNKKDAKEIDDSLAATKQNELLPVDLSDMANVGTEEVSSEDLNTPVLKIVQSNTQDVDDKKEGSLFRTDTGEQLDSVDVNLCYVTTKEMENYNKTGIEKVKVYFGFYAGSVEPFKMYVRGWSMNGHRQFQSEVVRMKGLWKIPMFALRVRLSTEKQQGTIESTGKPYTTHKLKFEVLKNEVGKPLFEQNQERITFLYNAVMQFKEQALVTSIESENDTKANDLPFA